MAATVAGLIRGRDVIQDASALMTIAAFQLDVPTLSFGEVITLLEDVGYVAGVKRSGGKVTEFTESVPFYDNLYATLGEAWRGRAPTILEQEMLAVINGLAQAPVSVDNLEDHFGIERSDIPELLEVADHSGLVRKLRSVDGDILYSPFFGFEDPGGLDALLSAHGGDRLAEELAAVRATQGLELTPGQYPLLTDAVGRGLIMAPSVTLPDGSARAFAALPYAADKSLLVSRKPVLEKALAVLACLRSAERHAEYNTLTPDALLFVIGKLLDPNRGFLNPNSSHRRQYQLMRNAGLIRFAPDTMPGGRWVTPTFIDTDDNREALRLARDLIQHGELVERRIDDEGARIALDTGAAYQAPLQTASRLRRVVAPSPDEYEMIFARAMGQGAV
jgi:hypothetical protein